MATESETLKQVILSTLREFGECQNGFGNDDRQPDLFELVVAEYERSKVPFDCILYEKVLHGLVTSRQVVKRGGRWEGEEHWKLAPKRESKKQLVMF